LIKYEDKLLLKLVTISASTEGECRIWIDPLLQLKNGYH
jgi:hypothetical protein